MCTQENRVQLPEGTENVPRKNCNPFFVYLLFTTPPGGLLSIRSHTGKALRHLVKFQPCIAHAALFVFGQAAEIGVTVS